jgi:hypothetical protein
MNILLMQIFTWVQFNRCKYSGGAVYKITRHAQLYAEKNMKKLQCTIMTKIIRPCIITKMASENLNLSYIKENWVKT